MIQSVVIIAAAAVVIIVVVIVVVVALGQIKHSVQTIFIFEEGSSSVLHEQGV